MDIAGEIAAHPFFEPLPDEHVAVVAGCGRNEHVAAGTLLARTGDPADRFYLVRRGAVALEVHDPGRGGVTVQTLHEGDVLGWSWLFPPYRWQFDARVVREASLIAFDGVCLRGKCDADPRLGYDLMKRFAEVITRRFTETRLQLLDVYGREHA